MRQTPANEEAKMADRIDAKSANGELLDFDSRRNEAHQADEANRQFDRTDHRAPKVGRFCRNAVEQHDGVVRKHEIRNHANERADETEAQKAAEAFVGGRRVPKTHSLEERLSRRPYSFAGRIVALSVVLLMVLQKTFGAVVVDHGKERKDLQACESRDVQVSPKHLSQTNKCL